jgi:hypothetical protein
MKEGKLFSNSSCVRAAAPSASYINCVEDVLAIHICRALVQRYCRFVCKVNSFPSVEFEPHAASNFSHCKNHAKTNSRFPLKCPVAQKRKDDIDFATPGNAYLCQKPRDTCETLSCVSDHSVRPVPPIHLQYIPHSITGTTLPVSNAFCCIPRPSKPPTRLSNGSALHQTENPNKP